MCLGARSWNKMGPEQSEAGLSQQEVSGQPGQTQHSGRSATWSGRWAQKRAVQAQLNARPGVAGSRGLLTVKAKV